MGGSPIPFRNFKISILTVPSTSEQSPLCSSFPTATRCAGLAVGGPPCGRHFSSLRNINFNRPLQKTPEIFGFRVFLAAKFGCFGSREYGFKGRPHSGRGTGEYQDICSCRREHLEKNKTTHSASHRPLLAHRVPPRRGRNIAPSVKAPHSCWQAAALARFAAKFRYLHALIRFSVLRGSPSYLQRHGF